MSSPRLQPSVVSNQVVTDQPKTAVRAWAIAGALALAVFLLQLTLAFRLNAHDQLRILNRFFDADNAWYLVNFETGDQKFGSYGGRNVVHPNVANFVHPAVKVATAALKLVSRKPREVLMTDVSLAVAPALAGLRSGLLLITLVTAGITLFDALLAAVLASVAFSSVIFGCLPESFVMSGAWFAAYFWLAAKAGSGEKLRYSWWILIGMLLASTTITNIAPFGLGIFILLWFFRKDQQPFRKTITIAAASLVLTVVCFVALTAAHGSFKGVGRKVGQMQEIQFNLHSMLVGMPRTFALTLVPMRPNEMVGSDEENRSKQIQTVRFTFRDDLETIKQGIPTIVSYRRFGEGRFWIWVVFVMIAGCTAISVGVLKSGNGSAIVLFVLCSAHLLFHWALHSVFGLELFLYSQHWTVPLVIIMSMGMTLSGIKRWLARGIMGLLTVAASIQGILVMQALINAS